MSPMMADGLNLSACSPFCNGPLNAISSTKKGEAITHTQIQNILIALIIAKSTIGTIKRIVINTFNQAPTTSAL